MMPYILNIHTSTETAIINLSRDSETLHTKINSDTKQHAAFLHKAVDELLQEEGILTKELSAVGITVGPGSYTGMRVGLAAAKGFCYALSLPLLTFNTLEVMAGSVADLIKDADALYCPMIDARRMEVYAGVYSFNLDEIEPPAAKIVTEKSYANYLETSKIVFSGSGSKKFKNLANLPGFFFTDAEISSEKLTQFSWDKFKNSDYANVNYAQPVYIKEFYTIG